MFSKYRELHLTEIVQDAEKPTGVMAGAHISFGSLGNQAHESNERNHVIKATISRLSIKSLLGSDQAPVCAVGERGGAEQGHLPSLLLSSSAL